MNTVVIPDLRISGDQEDDKTYSKEEFYAEIGLQKVCKAAYCTVGFQLMGHSSVQIFSENDP